MHGPPFCVIYDVMPFLIMAMQNKACVKIKQIMVFLGKMGLMVDG